jgi:cytochrome P450
MLQLNPSRVHLILENWAKQLGPVFRLALGSRDVLVTGSFEGVHHVLQARPAEFRRLSSVEISFRELGLDGVFSAEGDVWRRQRKLMMPAFSTRQLQTLFPAIVSKTRQLCERWNEAARSERVVEVRTDLLRYTADVSSYAVFGHDIDTLGGCQPGLQRELARIFHTINRRLAAPFPYWRLIRLPSDRAADRSLRRVQSYIVDLIARARTELERDSSEGMRSKTILNAMLAEQQHTDPAKRLSDDLVIGNVLTLFLAGEDTTANTLSWMLHYIAQQREVQHKLREEADTVLGPERVLSRPDDVTKLTYASALAQEVLRVRAAVPVLYFETLKDVELHGIALPKGTWVFTLLRNCSVDQANFSEPQHFSPERWLTGPGDGAAHNPRALLAFGAGPRTCPGKPLALLECALVASMVARNFDVLAVGDADAVEEQLQLTMHPHSVRVRLCARS